MITVDHASSTPPFEQLRLQIAASRESGEYAAGHRLPPVRHLAAELGIAPNTVARAYRELEASGVIETRGRHGSFITGTDDNLEAATVAAEEFAGRVRQLGVAPNVALRLVQDALG